MNRSFPGREKLKACLGLETGLHHLLPLPMISRKGAPVPDRDYGGYWEMVPCGQVSLGRWLEGLKPFLTSSINSPGLGVALGVQAQAQARLTLLHPAGLGNLLFLFMPGWRSCRCGT